MAYINAEKAFHYFKRTNAFRRAIQAESVMLLQYGSVTKTEFKHVEKRYKNLISDCDSLNEPTIKAMLLHNLGFEYFKRKQYQQAQNFFKQALLMAPKQSSLYLNRLYNYLDSCIEGKISPKADIFIKAKDGFHLAQKLKNLLYQHLFYLNQLKLEGKQEEYYQYIEQHALPFFQSNDHFTMLIKFGQQLYDHFTATKQYEKAVHLGKLHQAYNQ
jgi:tetratricopeptide (TPR) repeat protein